MFSYEDRLRAVQFYIKLGKRVGLTIRQLGSFVRESSGQECLSSHKRRQC